MGLLFRSKLVAFGPKEEMCACDNPVIRQFLAGRADGPIGMDEMADSDAPAAPTSPGVPGTTRPRRSRSGRPRWADRVPAAAPRRPHPDGTGHGRGPSRRW